MIATVPGFQDLQEVRRGGWGVVCRDYRRDFDRCRDRGTHVAFGKRFMTFDTHHPA